MTYQVLARKWRPQEFSALIGQEPIVTALRNGLTERRIAQAYLFSGIRGVGKTTAARLLAKALNCEQGPTAEPCNVCRPCREITGGSDLDVIEVDAATYSKVEQVRELTESLRYGPSADRYKVVVLDEIHRLSRQAFDALLKIVEEPPPHLTFIFATTEIDAVPATVLSRCQEFHFRRVPVEPLTAHLRRLCDAEEIEASDTALRLIARAGEGSVRDAVALLDQLATFGSGSIADEDAVRLLGGLDTALFFRLLEAILEGRSEEVVAVVSEVEDHGWDPRTVFAQFLAYVRDALHVRLGGSAERIDLPSEEIERLSELVGGQRYEDLLRLLHVLLESEETVRRSEAGALALEIAWLRVAELPKLRGVEDLLRGLPPSEDPRPSSGSRSTGKSAPPKRSSSGAAQQKERARGGQAPAAAEEPPRESAARSSASNQDVGGKLIEEVSLHRQPLAAHLAAAERLELEEGQVRIVVPAGDSFLEEALQRQGNRSLLDRVVRELWGEETRWVTVAGKSEAAKPRPAPSEAPSAASSDNGPSNGDRSEALADPTVQTVLDIFGGTVEAVEPRSSEE